MKVINVMFALICLFGYLFVVIGLPRIEKKQALETYNKGECEVCGGKWELYSASEKFNSPTVYHYRCLKCSRKFHTIYNHLERFR